METKKFLRKKKIWIRSKIRGADVFYFSIGMPEGAVDADVGVIASYKEAKYTGFYL